MTNKLTKEKVLEALSKVQEPELHEDLVTLNMIRDVKIDGGKVSFSIMLTTPACPLRGQIQKEAEQAVMSVGGVESVEIKMDSDVPNDGRMRGLVNMPIRNAIAVGSGKKGKLAVDFVAEPERLGQADALLLATIREGRDGEAGRMPPWGQMLDEGQMRDVLAYLRSAFGTP
jgi:ATP-binding protein involved in chromosome partitioning